MAVNHTVIINGDNAHEFRGSLDDAREKLARLLRALDGEKYYSVIVAALPSGKRIDDIDFTSWPVEYMQCAGSSAAMTCEIRESDDNHLVQYAIGRSSEKRSFEPDVCIRWSDFEVNVYEDEVFDADEALELFIHYLAHGAAPPGYALRRLELDKSK
jgi:hypothetical protein